MRDAGVQRDRRARAALPSGVRDGAGDAAVAHLDDDRALSRPVTASTRTRGYLPADDARRGRAAAAGRAIARPRSSRRSRWPAGSAWRADSTSTTTSRPPGSQSGPRARRPTRRSPSSAAASRPSAVRVGALLRSARAVYAAGAVSIAVPERAVPRRSGGHGRADRAGRPGVREERAGAGRRDPRRAIMVRGSAITARRTTATWSINRRCTCRWWWPGPGSAAGVSDTPVSTRRVFHTILDWAGLDVRAQPAPARTARSCSAKG